MIREIFAAVLTGLTLPDQPQDANAIYCRPPQQLPSVRLLGPPVCKPQRQWDDPHRKGLDIGPDGRAVVESEKYRSLHCGPGAGC